MNEFKDVLNRLDHILSMAVCHNAHIANLTLQIRENDEGTGTLIRGVSYQPTLEEEGIIKQTRNYYNVSLKKSV